MRFFSPLLGKSKKITQATYPCTIDGIAATIDGDAASVKGAFENLNNDIYGVAEDLASFKIKIDTEEAGSGAYDFIIPLNSSLTYDAKVDLGDGSFGYITGTGISSFQHTYSEMGIYEIKITGTFPSILFNNSGDKDKILDILQFGEIEWLYANSSFYGCSNMIISAEDGPKMSGALAFARFLANTTSLKKLSTRDWVTTNNNNMTSFIPNSGVEEIDFIGIDTDLVTTYSAAFLGCEKLKKITNSKYLVKGLTTTLRNMHNGNIALEEYDVSGWDMTSINSLAASFYRNLKLTYFDMTKWETPLLEDIGGMFFGCALLDVDISNLDISNLTNASSLMLGSGFGDNHYGLAMVSFAAQPHKIGVPFHAGTAVCPAWALYAKAILEAALWTFIDGET